MVQAFLSGDQRVMAAGGVGSVPAPSHASLLKHRCSFMFALCLSWGASVSAVRECVLQQPGPLALSPDGTGHGKKDILQG